MATINLASKYETKLDERYKLQSRTDSCIGTGYNWEGVNSIKVWSLTSADLNDYNASAASNRFGTPSEVDDEVNTYQLMKKRSFAKTFDITNVQDQMFTKRANAYLKQMWDEKYVPEIDKHRLQAWANGAGLGKLNGTKLTKGTIMEALLMADAALDDAFVPSEGRTFFVRTDIAVATKLATELAYSQEWVNKAIVRGKIGEINGNNVITVPKSIMPKGVEFMVKYRGATADPMKLKMLRANDNAPGYAGTLMEGLCRYDAFVLAQKADGIYVYAESDYCDAVTYELSGTSLTLSCSTASAVIKYTTDGTNPKASSTASTYSAALTVASGDKIRAYASKTGLTNGAISSYDVE